MMPAMKAAQYHQTGPVEVIKYEDVPDPVPGEGDVVLKVKAAAINRLDIFLRSGASKMPGFRLPHTGGFDIAGEIAAVGPGVDPKRIGEAVVVNARVTGTKARGSLDIIGIARPGGFAEKVVVPAANLEPKPTTYTFEEAAAFGCVYITAYYGLVLHAAVKPGEFVLVHGASGGAGSAAVQVAKAAGATVIAVCGSREKCEKAKTLLGADHVVNHREADFVEVVKRVTNGRGADAVFDPIWGETAPKTMEAIADYGRWIVLGMISGWDAPINSAKLMFKEVTIRGIVEFHSDARQLAGAWSLAHRGLVRPVVAKAWPLKELGAAQKQMETGDFFGKIVVVP